jgi:hypothetical protein
MIHDFVKELDLEDEIKIMILERLSTSLLFEKIRRFAIGRGERQEYKEYLLRNKQKELKKSKKPEKPSFKRKVIRKILG